jgi:precorrin isomerase
MAKEKLTESESRYISIIGRLGGTATVRQVANMLGVSRKLERVREELLSMSVR